MWTEMRYLRLFQPLVDTFVHDETDYCLVGRRSGKKFRMGDKLKIKVVAANLTKRQLDYEWVMENSKKRN